MTSGSRIAEIQAPLASGGEHGVDYSPAPADTVKATTCYMCACRCGINVHLKDGRIRHIEGNREHPVNRGVLCAKGAAGLRSHYSRARLSKPLLRVGERGRKQFREIEWEEALALATQWLGEIRARDPKRLAFFTGRDQSQALTAWWAMQFGTPNYAAHGGFCSVNMAAAGLYTLGGSFWEFGEPDWEQARYVMLFGVAEDHDSNPIKRGLGALKSRAADSRAKYVAVNPVRSGYAALADEWIGIRPGSDGILILSLIRELLLAERIDLDFLVRYTNAPWLVVEAPGTAEHGLFARDIDGAPLAFDRKDGRIACATNAGIAPLLTGAVTLPDGRKARPVFDLLLAHHRDPAFAPERAEAATGIPAATIRRLAAELAHAAFAESVTLPIAWTDWAGRRHESIIGRPVAFHAMRGISAHANGFQTCRALHLLQMLLGAIDSPGGWLYKPPYPRPIPPAARPGRMLEPGQPLTAMPLGYPQRPEDLLIDDDGRPERIDKAFSWEAPLAIHGQLQSVIRNAWAGDPYEIDTLFLYMSNMAWNSAMNTAETMRMLTDRDPASGGYRIPRIIYADAFDSEMVAFADLVLPDTTYLERWDCISLLDRPISRADCAADAIRQPVLPPDRDVRAFQDVLIDLGTRLDLPGFRDPDGRPLYPAGLSDYVLKHERRPGIGMLAGWRGAEGEDGGKGAPNPRQLSRYIENGCFWAAPIPPEARYFRFGNRAYLEWATAMGFIDRPEPITLQIYSEPLRRFQLAGEGFGALLPPEEMRERLRANFSPLPTWTPAEAEDATYPLSAISQRPMPMYHSWGSHNAWLRQIQARNPLFLHRATAAALGLADGDQVWIESRIGRVKARIWTMSGVERGTVWTWNAIAKRPDAWGLQPDAPEATGSFLLNHLVPDQSAPAHGRLYANADPVTGQAAWFDLKVRLVRCEGETAS